MIFEDRKDAGRQLGKELRRLSLRDPLVLGIPRGGVATGAAIAKTIDAELDVVFAHKLRCPGHPEFAIGAVGEKGVPLFDEALLHRLGINEHEFLLECQEEIDEISRRKRLFRWVRPPAEIEGRSVIIADDGIATGSTMLAALAAIRQRRPYELIVAVPVVPRNRYEAIAANCDHLVCLQVATAFHSVSEFYRSFKTVTDEQVVKTLRAFAPVGGG